MLRAIFCGIALGAALGAKYSAVILPLIAALLMLASVRWAAAAARSAPGQHPKCDPSRVPRGARSRLLRCAFGYAVMCAAAFVILQAIYLFPSDLLQYLRGWSGIYGGATAGFQAYMAGQLRPRFYSYYVVAYLLKEPLASITLALIGLVLVARSKTTSPLARSFLIVPPALIVAGYTMMSYDIGIRYVLPALPFAYLLGGVAIARLLRATRTSVRVVGAAMCAWVAIAAIGIYPDHLSYFNESACLLDQPSKVGLDGGSRCGPTWLDDSNVDWGQGLEQLRSWLDRNARGRQVRMGYFGSVPPAAYGIRQTPMTDEQILFGNDPGLYAVSAHIVASTPAVAKQARGSGAEWLRQRAPVAIVGHAYYIFEVPEQKSAR